MQAKSRGIGLMIAMISGAMLAACGGGGGSDTPPAPPPSPAPTALAISNSNYVSVAQQSLSSGQYLLNSSGVIKAADANSKPAVMQQAAQLALQLVKGFKPTAALIAGASTSQSTACTQGGRLDFSFSDTNGNGKFDAGDSLTAVARACNQTGLIMDGQMDMAFVTLTGDLSSDFSATIDLRMTSFVMTSTTGKMTCDGAMRMVMTVQGLDRIAMDMSGSSFSAYGKTGSTDIQEKLENFGFNAAIVPAGFGVTETTSSVRGTLTSATLGNKPVTIEALVPFKVLSNQSAPTAGQQLVRGAAGSAVRITVQAGARVLLELDADGNGQYEQSVTKNWSELN